MKKANYESETASLVQGGEKHVGFHSLGFSREIRLELTLLRAFFRILEKFGQGIEILTSSLVVRTWEEFAKTTLASVFLQSATVDRRNRAALSCCG